jgi:hypothetical protein
MKKLKEIVSAPEYIMQVTTSAIDDGNKEGVLIVATTALTSQGRIFQKFDGSDWDEI